MRLALPWPAWLTWRRGFIGAVALGAAIRLFVLAQKWDRELLLNDSIWYSYVATDLTQGVWFRDILTGGPTAEHAPLTSLVITPLSFLPDALVGQRITTALLGIASVAVVALAGRRFGGDRVGILAGLLAAVYPNMWLSDGLVMSESLAILLVSLFVFVALDWVPHPSVAGGLLIGALCGLGALTRSELLLLAPLVAVVVWREHGWRASWRSAGSAALGCLLVLLPWFGFNVSRFERPVLLTTNDGTTLYGANCDDVYSGPNLGGWSVFCVFDAPKIDGDDSVRSAEQRRLAVAYVRDNLDRVPLVLGARILRTVDLYGVSDMVNGDVGEERPRNAVWAGIVMMWALIPLAAIGLWRTRGTDRKVLLLPVVVVAVTTVLFYGGHRLRAPAEPVLCLGAAVTLAGASPDRRRHHAGNPLDPVVGEAAVGEPHDDQVVGVAGQRTGGTEGLNPVPPLTGA
jgi:4-amino-4-deoxy-L-arabinose transferase-like glycosyltransferase